MEERREPKTLHRLIPCPVYDVSGLECWLSDMAKQGLILQKDGIFLGVVTFEKSTPTNIRYRLLPADKKISMWADNGGDPDDEVVELSKEFGWEYVAKRGEFHIYRTIEEDAREIHTDVEVQALAMNAMRKRQRDSIFHSLFFGLIYPVLILRGMLVLFMIYAGTIPILLFIAASLWTTINSLVCAFRLMGLRKKILRGEDTGSGSNWKVGAWKYHAGNFLRRVTFLAAILMLLRILGDQMIYENYIPLAEYTKEPPFATMEDLLDGGERELMNMRVGNLNTAHDWEDILSPVNYEWDEACTVTHPDGRVLSGGLEVCYHETKADWIAKRAAREYLIKGKQEKDYEPLELEIEGMDEVVAYETSLHFPCIILRNDNKVLYARFYTNGSDTVQYSLQEWADIMAESLR